MFASPATQVVSGLTQSSGGDEIAHVVKIDCELAVLLNGS